MLQQGQSLMEYQGRVLPVYVSDLDYNPISLLDRYHQSVAFKDMVVSVRTKNTQTESYYCCNGRRVFTQTRELERPRVGSILQISSLPPLDVIKIRFQVQLEPTTSWAMPHKDIGALAGCAAPVGSYPFDLLRTSLASQGEPKIMAGLSLSSGNALLSGYPQNENHKEAINLFREMQFQGV
ncbi:hypothetical protein U1Q18_037885 [Sarracenia purpurea var. burkii]